MNLYYYILFFGHAALVVSETTAKALTTTTPKIEKNCTKLPQHHWNLKGCHVTDPSSSTVTGLGAAKPYTNFKSCKISCEEEGENFQIDSEPMDVCEPGLVDTGFPNEGYFLPAFLPGENDISIAARAVIYFALLAYCFVGVAIIADIFMGAIEVITSSRREVTMPDGRTFHVRVWNDTVANLTLMALGSSAPEIILSVIEVISSGFFAGELGPSTIVGSAAFNLFCIAALCVVAVGEPARTIRYQPVFFVTAIFSVLAYVWLVFILSVQSPNLVEVWEGVASFLFFIILVVIAFMADRGMLSCCCKSDKVAKIDGHARVAPDIPPDQYMGVVRQIIARENHEVTPEDIVKILKLIRKDQPHMTNHEAAKILKEKVQQEIGFGQPHSKAYYRSRAMKGLTGTQEGDAKEDKPVDTPLVNKEITKKLLRSMTQAERDSRFMRWSSSLYAVLEEPGAKCVLTIERGPGLWLSKQTVKINTIDGAAVGGKDFVPLKDFVVEFQENDRKAEVIIDIVSDKTFEDTEMFGVQMSAPEPFCTLQKDGGTNVRITQENQSGVLVFKEHTYWATESERKVVLTVCRKEGSIGEVKVKYKTQDISAVADSDYVPEKDGLLVFKHGEAEKDITIEIIDDEDYEKDEEFLVTLFEPSDGAMFYQDHDGGDEEEIAKVVIISDEKQKNMVDEMSMFFNINQDRIKMGASNYKDQFLDAIYPGGYDKDRKCKAKACTWFSHILSFPWKFLFALVPPPGICGGIPTFIIALSFIAVLTMFIADLASLAGCCVGFKKAFTAITIVALGTSLPDAFASKAAAQGDKHADNSIGNITGSNSVNVFLGLGLPWCIASIYWMLVPVGSPEAEAWEIQYGDVDEAMAWLKTHNQLIFVVRAGSLGFGVTIFCIGATVTLAMLEVRRYCKCCGNGELGGPAVTKWLTCIFFVLIWISYIALSGLNIYGLVG